MSHPFKDEDLALTLKQILEEVKEIDEAYIAQRVKEYELLIRDKIKQQIENSDYVVALITRNTVESASVNQELGYAQGKNIPIIPLIEEDAKIGVLIYGLDAEKFNRENYEDAFKNVREYIVKKGPKNKTSGKIIDSTNFLKKRKLYDAESTNFAENEHVGLLKTQVEDELAPNGKSIVFFSACPKILKDMVDVNSKVFTDWLEQHQTIKIQDHSSKFLKGDKTISLDQLTYYYDHSGQGDIYSYIDFMKNGFFEQGITRWIIHSDATQKGKFVLLNLCFLTGAYWAFLIFCKKYYEKIRYEEEFDVFLSIRNSKDLTLMGFGGKIKKDNGESKWAEPYDHWWDSKLPQTKLLNISLRLESITTKDLSDDFIEKQVRKISERISNAYGLSSSMCYNFDGTFNFGLFSYYGY